MNLTHTLAHSHTLVPGLIITNRNSDKYEGSWSPILSVNSYISDSRSHSLSHTHTLCYDTKKPADRYISVPFFTQHIFFFLHFLPLLFQKPHFESGTQPLYHYFALRKRFWRKGRGNWGSNFFWGGHIQQRGHLWATFHFCGHILSPSQFRLGALNESYITTSYQDSGWGRGRGG